MNVFPEQTSLVTLTACPGSHDCAIIAILLEALRLPHTLRLIKTPTQSNTHALSHLPYLTDIQPTGATTTRADVLSAAFYLLGRYDQGRRLVSKKRDGHESLEIVNWTRDWIERARGRESQHEQTESKRKSQRRSVSEEPSYDRTHMSHAKVVRRTLHLYLLLEKRLQDRTSGGYLVGGRCTIADLFHVPVVAAAGSLGFDLERFPELTAWFNRLSMMEAVQRGMAAVRLDLG